MGLCEIGSGKSWGFGKAFVDWGHEDTDSGYRPEQDRLEVYIAQRESILLFQWHPPPENRPHAQVNHPRHTSSHSIVRNSDERGSVAGMRLVHEPPPAEIPLPGHQPQTKRTFESVPLWP